MASLKISTLAALALAAVALAACGSDDGRVRYDGVPFKVKTKAADKKVSRKEFIVEVQDAQRSLEGAREAGYHGGVTYCLTDGGYGTSNIIWEVDPTDPETALVFEGSSAVFRGKCDP